MIPPTLEQASEGTATQSWQALGTTVVLSIPEADDARRLAARRAVEDEIEAIDRAASRFRTDSELTLVNRSPESWVPISRLLFDAIELGLLAAEVTNGAVDPTLGESLIHVGYDRDWSELTPIGQQAGSEARPRLVLRRQRHLWPEVELRQDPPAVRVPHGVLLDLGATAKALATDRSARAAGVAGGAGVLVAIGGDIATDGPPPQDGWMVHVTDDHRAGATAPGQTVSIHSGGLATSSTRVRRWLHRGQPMHHILNPHDGQPARSRWRTASVAAASCAEANIASTAAIVLDDEASPWLEQQGLPARLVATDGAVEVCCGWPR
jgi:thiamine biosynthesis lipoprotein